LFDLPEKQVIPFRPLVISFRSSAVFPADLENGDYQQFPENGAPIANQCSQQSVLLGTLQQ